MLGSNLDIMSPQWTNVIFKDRNQAYGAYQLRKDNASNTMRALMIAGGLFIFILALPTIINKIKGFIPEADPIIKTTVVDLVPPPAIEQKAVEPPPVQEKQVKAHNDVIKFLPPIVKPDPEAREEPPTQIEITKADVGNDNIKGDPTAPIADIGTKVGATTIEGVTESTNNDKPFIAVEVNPVFPGGEEAFGKFLRDHIRYPAVAKENGVQGRAFIQFVVERDGSLTDLKIIRDPGSGIGEEAARVLKMSPHWSAGIQNGKKVRVQYTVPVNFSLAE